MLILFVYSMYSHDNFDEAYIQIQTARFRINHHTRRHKPYDGIATAPYDLPINAISEIYDTFK